MLNAGVSYARGDVDGLVSAGLTLFNRWTRGRNAREISLRTKTSQADVIQFSGCKDYQKASDTVADVSLSTEGMLKQIGTSHWRYELGLS